ncbi:MAG: site-specific integrase [Desulfurococcaceae archaeon]
METIDLETFKLRAKSIYPESSVRRKEVVLRKYGDFLRERGLKPGVESLSLWLDELVREGYGASTVRAYAYDVISYFEIMMLEIDERKLRLLKKRLPPLEVSKVDCLTDEEVAKLIRTCPSPVRKLIYSVMYTYARRIGEVLSLTWRDVDLERGTITFRILKKRREERATYELEPWIKEMILRYREFLGRDRLFEITGRAVEMGFKRDCMRAGIEPRGRRLRLHILRHSRITSLRERGVPLDVVSKYLARHSRFDTTVQFYLGSSAESISRIPRAGEVLGFVRRA